MARYRKIDTRIWNDQKFNELSDNGKLAFFLLLTHPHLTPIGAMRASLPGLASELRWPFEKLQEALNESYIHNMIQYDESASFIWIPNFLKYNQPESPNVIRSWENLLDYLPECTLKNHLIKHIKSHVLKMTLPFREALSITFDKNIPNQEQEQEQEQNKNCVQTQLIRIDSNNEIVSDIDKYKAKNRHNKLKSQALEVLDFLNKKTGKQFRSVDTNLNLIMARLNTGATVIDCRQIIARKYREWKDNPEMTKYLRPETLFAAKKFESYIGELVLPNHSEISNEQK